MDTTVLLVRHGQTNSNVSGFHIGWSNEDLDEMGYIQVRRLSSRLAHLPIISAYNNPLQRSYVTAVILAESHKPEPKVLHDLTEIQLGGWQGLHMDQIKRRWPELWQQWRVDSSQVTIPNGESISKVTEWAVRAFRSIVSANQGK